MKLIPLTQGKFAKVDNEDYPALSRFHWFYNHGYAYRMLPTVDGKRARVSMQDAVNPPRAGEVNDHINHDRSDNRKSNLRSVTYSKNNLNRTPKGHAYFDARLPNRPWYSVIKTGGKVIYCGYFKTKQEAAEAKSKKLEALL